MTPVFFITFHIIDQLILKIYPVVSYKLKFIFVMCRSFNWITKVHFIKICQTLVSRKSIIFLNFQFISQNGLTSPYHFQFNSSFSSYLYFIDVPYWQIYSYPISYQFQTHLYQFHHTYHQNSEIQESSN